MVTIVAELSGNHGGDWERAVRLVQAAAAAGVDYVKGQCFTPDGMCLPGVHRLNWAGCEYDLHELYAETAMPYEWHARLVALCRELGLGYFASEFTIADVDHMDALGVDYHKCASFELTDLPLIRHMGSKGKPVMLSTGMATADEIREAARAARNGKAPVYLLVCTSAYPAAIADARLERIRDLWDVVGWAPTGLSDHTLSLAVPVVATVLGAYVIEKHFTLARADGGPDAAFSLEPAELAAMVRAVREAEQALGEATYGPTAAERPLLGLRRSLWVTRDTALGELWTPANVQSLRPMGGLPPARLPDVLGKRAARACRRGEPLAEEMINVRDHD